VEEAFQTVYNGGLNEYALYLDCYSPTSGVPAERYRQEMLNLFRFNPKVYKLLHRQKVRAAVVFLTGWLG